MIAIFFDDITKEDIDFLIDNRIGESKTLEYKGACMSFDVDGKWMLG